MKNFILIFLAVIFYNIKAIANKEREYNNDKNYIEDEEFVYSKIDEIKKIEDTKKVEIEKKIINNINKYEEQRKLKYKENMEQKILENKNIFERYSHLQLSLEDLMIISNKVSIPKTDFPLIWEYFLGLNTQSFLDLLKLKNLEEKILNRRMENLEKDIKEESEDSKPEWKEELDNEDNSENNQDELDSNAKNKKDSYYQIFKIYISKFFMILLEEKNLYVILLHCFSLIMYLIPYKIMDHPKLSLSVLMTFFVVNFYLLDSFYAAKYYFSSFISYFFLIFNIEKLWNCLFSIENIWEIEENLLNENSFFDPFNFNTKDKFFRKVTLTFLVLFFSIYLTVTKYRASYFFIFQFYIYRLIRFIFIRYFKYNCITPCELQPFENFIDILIACFCLIFSNWYYYYNISESQELLSFIFVYNFISFYFLTSLDKYLFVYRNGLSDIFFEYSLYSDKNINEEKEKNENINNIKVNENKTNIYNKEDNSKDCNIPNENINESINESNSEIINSSNLEKDKNITNQNHTAKANIENEKPDCSNNNTISNKNQKSTNKSTSKNTYKKNKKKEKENLRNEWNNPSGDGQNGKDESSDDEILTLENLRKFKSFQELVDKINLKRYYRIDIFNIGNIIDIIIITLITMILIFSFFVESIFLLFLSIYLLNVFFKNNAIYVSTKHSRLLSNFFHFILMLSIYDVNFHKFSFLNQLSFKGAEIYNYKIMLKIVLKFLLFCFAFKSLFVNNDFLSYFNIYYYSSFKYVQQEGVNVKKINENSELMFRINEVYNFKSCLEEIFCFNLEKSINYINYIFENCKFFGKKSDFSILEFSLEKHTKNVNIIYLLLDYILLYFSYWLTYFVFKDNSNIFYYMLFNLFKLAVIIKMFFLVFEYSKSLPQKYLLIVLNTILFNRLISFFDEFYFDYYAFKALLFLNKLIYIFYCRNSFLINCYLSFLEIIEYRKYGDIVIFVLFISLLFSKNLLNFFGKISKKIKAIVYFSAFTLFSLFLFLQVERYIYSLISLMQEKIIKNLKTDWIGIFESLYFNCVYVSNVPDNNLIDISNNLLENKQIRCKNSIFIEAYLIRELLKKLIKLKIFV